MFCNINNGGIRLAASISKRGETCPLSFDLEKCSACGDCIEVCEDNAISIYNPDFVDLNQCSCCGECVQTCEERALTLITRKKGLPPFSKKI